MSNAKILTKVQKLLRLAESSNPGEAAAAAARAQHLIDKHRLSMADLEASPSLRDHGVVQDEALDWHSQLLSVLAEYNGCAVYLTDDESAGLVGEENDCAAVRELYTYLTREIDRLSQGIPAKKLPSFCSGAVEAVEWALEDQAAEARKRAKKTESTALVTTSAVLVAARREAANDYLADEMGAEPADEPEAADDLDAFLAGILTGKCLDIGRRSNRLEESR